LHEQEVHNILRATMHSNSKKKKEVGNLAMNYFSTIKLLHKKKKLDLQLVFTTVF
jgi:ABC-type polar amino acid transport system ATPase subunit